MKSSCKKCKDYSEHYYWEHSHKNQARFYKSMVGDFTDSMSLPQKFYSKCKQKLPEVIVLEGPRGDKWSVTLVTHENNVLLKGGWREFLEGYKIKENDKLFFEYDGDSCFTVIIFSSSECELESSQKNKPLKTESEENSVQILEPKFRAEHVLYHCRSDSSASSDNASEDSCPLESDQREAASLPKRGTRKGKENLSVKREPDEERVDNNEPVPSRKREATIQSEDASKPGCRSFSVVMKPSNVGKGQFQVIIPVDFARKYLPAKDFTTILQIRGKNKKWKISCTTSYGYRLLGNWRTFARDNDLKVGDECVFELSAIKRSRLEAKKDKKRVILTVHIIRAISKMQPSV